MSEAKTVISLSIGYFVCEDAAHPEYVPKRPMDRREEPYYIDSECPYCETELELCDEGKSHGVYDEWVCPTCERGLHMDWPNELKPLSDAE